MARLAAPLGYRKPAEPMARPERRWFDGIATVLRTRLSNMGEADPEIGLAIFRLNAID